MLECQHALPTSEVPARQSRLVDCAPFHRDLSVSTILPYHRDDSIADTLLHQETSLLEHHHPRLCKGKR